MAIECLDCTTWPSGSLDIQSTSAGFIFSYGSSSPDNPSDPSSQFSQHADYGNFKMNLKIAQTSNTANTPPPIEAGKANTDGGGGLTRRQWVIDDIIELK